VVGAYLTVWAVTISIKRLYTLKELEVARCVTMVAGLLDSACIKVGLFPDVEYKLTFTNCLKFLSSCLVGVRSVAQFKSKLTYKFRTP
jgi:hypothetical protein